MHDLGVVYSSRSYVILKNRCSFVLLLFTIYSSVDLHTHYVHPKLVD